jgi:predicted ribosome quality control (RQC) complex YloA/Tae2 family protein
LRSTFGDITEILESDSSDEDKKKKKKKKKKKHKKAKKEKKSVIYSNTLPVFTYFSACRRTSRARRSCKSRRT